MQEGHTQENQFFNVEKERAWLQENGVQEHDLWDQGKPLARGIGPLKPKLREWVCVCVCVCVCVASFPLKFGIGGRGDHSLIGQA